MAPDPITVTITEPGAIRRLGLLAYQVGPAKAEAAIAEAVARAVRAVVGYHAGLSMREVAAMLECCLNTVKNYHRAGKFPHAYYRSSRCVRIPLRDVLALMDRTTTIRHLRQEVTVLPMVGVHEFWRQELTKR